MPLRMLQIIILSDCFIRDFKISMCYSAATSHDNKYRISSINTPGVLLFSRLKSKLYVPK